MKYTRYIFEHGPNEFWIDVTLNGKSIAPCYGKPFNNFTQAEIEADLIIKEHKATYGKKEK